jgi:hypothetical protein
MDIFHGHLEYFMEIRDILWSFGTFCVHLVLFPGLVSCTKKDLAALVSIASVFADHFPIFDRPMSKQVSLCWKTVFRRFSFLIRPTKSCLIFSHVCSKIFLLFLQWFAITSFPALISQVSDVTGFKIDLKGECAYVCNVRMQVTFVMYLCKLHL